MRPVDQLHERFPWLPGELSVRDGWAGILARLAVRLEEAVGRERLLRGAEIRRAGGVQFWRGGYAARENPDGPYVGTVKEKFGTLRVYVHGIAGNEAAAAAVREAEEESARTCEVCGRPGAVRPFPWRQTLCDDHEAEYRALAPTMSGPALRTLQAERARESFGDEFDGWPELFSPKPGLPAATSPPTLKRGATGRRHLDPGRTPGDGGEDA